MATVPSHCEETLTAAMERARFFRAEDDRPRRVAQRRPPVVGALLDAAARDVQRPQWARLERREVARRRHERGFQR
jgi:hypothetical protein